MKIRIVARPEGEAPEWVRDAWIGLELPLFVAKQISVRGFGVVTGPKSTLGMFAAAIFGSRGFSTTGYAVRALVAFDLLETHDAAAAAWWRANTPHLFQKSACLVFDQGACEGPIEISGGPE